MSNSGYDYPGDGPLDLTPGTGLPAILARTRELVSLLADHYADELIVDYAGRKKIARALKANLAEFRQFVSEYRIEVTRRKPKAAVRRRK